MIAYFTEDSYLPQSWDILRGEVVKGPLPYREAVDELDAFYRTATDRSGSDQEGECVICRLAPSAVMVAVWSRWRGWITTRKQIDSPAAPR